MSAWKWIKTAASAGTGGMSSLYLYGGLLLAGAALAVGAVWWHAGKVDAVRDAAFSAGRMEVESEQLRETQRELTRMVGITNNLNEVYREQTATIDDLERRARTDGVRVTKAQRDAAIAQGSAEAVRHYASVAGDVYQACRDEYRALGYDAARGSATAATLKAWVDSYAPAKEFDNKLTTFTDQLKGNQ